MPTLLIWGEEDTALGKELTYDMEQYVPNLRIRYIPHCSHWVQQEQPELVNEYMQEFLAALA
jgi:pimeloyl-ACP methyl ester carboxylesterase